MTPYHLAITPIDGTVKHANPKRVSDIDKTNSAWLGVNTTLCDINDNLTFELNVFPK